MKIEYAIPSYGRPDGVTTIGYIPRQGKMYVSPEDYPDYVKSNPQFKEQIVKLPEDVQGHGKAHVMNWLLDNLWSEDTDAVLFLDDDISCLMSRNLDGNDHEVDEEGFYELCEDYVLLAKEWGCGIFSYSITYDPLTYDEFKPFRMHAYLDGTLQALVQNDGIRYDEALTVKEDVDMFLQEELKYHKALRVEKYYFKVQSFTGVGGSQAFRSENTEKKQFKLMQKKWGSKIVRPNRPSAKKSSNIRSVGGAIRINLPLSGA